MHVTVEAEMVELDTSLYRETIFILTSHEQILFTLNTEARNILEIQNTYFHSARIMKPVILSLFLINKTFPFTYHAETAYACALDLLNHHTIPKCVKDVNMMLLCT